MILYFCLAILFSMPATTAFASSVQESETNSEVVEDETPVENLQLNSETNEFQTSESESGHGILDRIKESLESFRFSEPVFITDPVIFGALDGDARYHIFRQQSVDGTPLADCRIHNIGCNWHWFCQLCQQHEHFD